jgi:hypothetical protein
MAGIDAAGVEKQVLRLWSAHQPARPAVAGRIS